MPNIDISIIIVNWNAKELLHNCLESILKETKEFPYEIVVVDNNSNDGSVELLESDYKNKITLIKNTENRGFAYANNQGMKVSKGEYLLLLNSDTVILDGAIDKSVGYIKKDKEIGLVGCKLLNSDGTLQPSCYNFNSLLSAFLFKSKFINNVKKEKRYKYEGLITSFDYNKKHEIDYVCGAYMLFSREVMNKIGFLDDSFFMYGEEADYCARVKQKGYKVIYYPDAAIIHYGGGSSKKISIISENRRIISRLKFIRKHKGFIYSQVYRFFSVLFVVFNIVKATIKGNIENKNANKSKLKALINLEYR